MYWIYLSESINGMLHLLFFCVNSTFFSGSMQVEDEKATFENHKINGHRSGVTILTRIEVFQKMSLHPDCQSIFLYSI